MISTAISQTGIGKGMIGRQKAIECKKGEITIVVEEDGGFVFLSAFFQLHRKKIQTAKRTTAALSKWAE